MTPNGDHGRVSSITPTAFLPLVVEKRSIHNRSEAGRSGRVPVREELSSIGLSKGSDPVTGGRSTHKGDTPGICPAVATGAAIASNRTIKVRRCRLSIDERWRIQRGAARRWGTRGAFGRVNRRGRALIVYN